MKLEREKMATLPDLSIKKADVIVEKIYEAYEAKAHSGGNERMGASDLGGPCDRALWYSFRWASARSFEGRMLRLFGSGFAQESRLIEDLRNIGCTIQDVNPETGKQWKATINRVVVKPDGILSGLPGSEKTSYILECKSSNEKNFKALLKDGLQKAKPDHWLQTQLEMRAFGLDRACYISVNKNDDSLYAERIEYNKQIAEAALARAERIGAMENPPERPYKDETFFICRFCPHSEICWNDKPAQPNCRTCLNSTSNPDGSWECAKWETTLSYLEQQEGCSSHMYIPSLMPHSKAVDASEEEGWVEYDSGGEIWKNGKDHITSKEIFESDNHES